MTVRCGEMSGKEDNFTFDRAYRANKGASHSRPLSAFGLDQTETGLNDIQHPQRVLITLVHRTIGPTPRQLVDDSLSTDPRSEVNQCGLAAQANR